MKTIYTTLSFMHLCLNIKLLRILILFAISPVFLFAMQPELERAQWHCDIWYNISSFELRYQYKGRANLPSLEELCQVELEINETDKGFTGYSSDNINKISLSEMSGSNKHLYHFSAVKSIQDQLIKYLNSCGIGGVVILPARGQIDFDELIDLRPNAHTKPQPLLIDIWVAKVVDLSIKTSNEKEQALTPSQNRILKYSPIRPYSEQSDDPNSDVDNSTDIIASQELDDYLYLLNRHPGRRVDASIAPGGKPGDIALEYNVRENKPWLAYAQVSNTGSKDTNDFRQRFGYVNNQLTGNDDIFNIDYLTTDYSDVHSVAVSYDRPWFDSKLTRFKVFGSYSDYISSEIGSNSYFSGSESTASIEITKNIHQKGRLFVDQFAGLRISNYKIDNYTIIESPKFADELMIVPSIGYRLDNDRGVLRAFGQVDLEVGFSPDGSVSDKNGREKPDSNWWKINWNINHSFYLEPVWDPIGWRDIKTPKNSTLAHEIAISGRGQFTRSRLISQEKMSIGGLYSVRGYRQSFVSGDNVMIVSGEYRYHIPRAFDLASPVKLPLFDKKFRWAPEQVYGFPDWDLIFKTFLDGGFATHNNMTANEDNFGLLSGGIGMELQVNRYFSVKCDYGIVIEGVEANDERAERGDGRFHISGMVAY